MSEFDRALGAGPEEPERPYTLHLCTACGTRMTSPGKRPRRFCDICQCAYSHGSNEGFASGMKAAAYLARQEGQKGLADAIENAAEAAKARLRGEQDRLKTGQAPI